MNKIVPLPRKNNREKVYNMVIHVRKLPFGGDFLAINLCGLIFAVRDLSPKELNHERIHTAQQRELLFLPFFLWYAAEWLVLMARYRNGIEAYYRIRFEREAYRHRPSPTIWPAAATIATSPDPAGAPPPLQCHRKKFIRPLSCPHKITGG